MKKFNLLACTIIAFSAISCSKDDNNAVAITPVNEEEVITTVVATLTNGANTITLQSRDLDGEGPNAPVVSVGGTLLANTTYNGKVKFLNEISTPASDISAEVLEEGVDHQIFFQPLPTTLGTFSYTDSDANGNPIGLSFAMTTGSGATGNLVLTLRHLPIKTANGVSQGNIQNAAGNTDAEVIFPIVIE